MAPTTGLVDALEGAGGGPGDSVDAPQLARRVAAVAGDEHLAALGRLGDPGGDVHDVADHVVARARPTSPRCTPARSRSGVGRGVEQLDGAVHRRRRLGEREHEPVAEALDDPAAPAAHDRPDGAVVLGEQRGGGLVAGSAP